MDKPNDNAIWEREHRVQSFEVGSMLLEAQP